MEVRHKAKSTQVPQKELVLQKELDKAKNQQARDEKEKKPKKQTCFDPLPESATVQLPARFPEGTGGASIPKKGEDRSGIWVAPASYPQIEPVSILTQAFETLGQKISTQQKEKGEMAGSTLSAALIIDRQITVANAGDSRVMVVYMQANGQYVCERLSYDYKARGCDEEERKRIEDFCGPQGERGGLIGDRLFGTTGLNSAITRSFGDSDIPAVTYQPGMTQYVLPTDVKKAKLIFASDGLTDVMQERDIAAILNEPVFREKYTASDNQSQCLADELVQKAWEYGTQDDTTVIVSSVPVEETDSNTPVLCFVADGHGANKKKGAIVSTQLASEFPIVVDQLMQALVVEPQINVLSNVDNTVEPIPAANSSDEKKKATAFPRASYQVVFLSEIHITFSSYLLHPSHQEQLKINISKHINPMLKANSYGDCENLMAHLFDGLVNKARLIQYGGFEKLIKQIKEEINNTNRINYQISFKRILVQALEDLFDEECKIENKIANALILNKEIFQLWESARRSGLFQMGLVAAYMQLFNSFLELELDQARQEQNEKYEDALSEYQKQFQYEWQHFLQQPGSKGLLLFPDTRKKFLHDEAKRLLLFSRNEEVSGPSNSSSYSDMEMEGAQSLESEINQPNVFSSNSSAIFAGAAGVSGGLGAGAVIGFIVGLVLSPAIGPWALIIFPVLFGGVGAYAGGRMGIKCGMYDDEHNEPVVGTSCSIFRCLGASDATYQPFQQARPRQIELEEIDNSNSQQDEIDSKDEEQAIKTVSQQPKLQ